MSIAPPEIGGGAAAGGREVQRNDPVARFYLKQLGGPWRETLSVVCPFCRERGFEPGKLVVFLNPDSFFHGYFRCLNRCVPGGFPGWFAHLAGLAASEAPGHEPDWDVPSPGAEYPVENINDEVRSSVEQIPAGLLEQFHRRGISPAALTEMRVGFNGRYLVFPYFQKDGNCYSARCVHPQRLEDFFWQGDPRFSREPFDLYNVADLDRCEGGALFVCTGEENLLTLRQLGFPGVAVAYYSGLERLSSQLFERIRTVFIAVDNSREAENAARELAARLGYKARILAWPVELPGRYSLWQLAEDAGKGFAARVGEMVKKAQAFSPFSSPQREYRLFLDQLADQQGEEYRRIASGFPLLDHALGGIHGINVVGGAPKVGKSTFMIQIAAEMALRRIPVLYYDFENGRQKIYQRTLSRLARLSTGQCRDELLSVPEKERYDEASRRLEKMLFFWRVINDRKVSPELLRRHIDFIRHETRSAYTVVVIDSLHKLPFHDFTERRSGIDAWLRQMESIRDEMQVSFLVISELSRDEAGGYRAEPHLGVFKGSGDIEYSADNAMVLYPAEPHSSRRQGEHPGNILWLVASREHSPGRVAGYRLDYPFWGFTEYPLSEHSE
jgi:replicative DNA helicase